MQVGDKYLAEWWFGYDMADCEKGEIAIESIRDESYTFSFANKWGTQIFQSNQCRSINLIKHMEKTEEKGIILVQLPIIKHQLSIVGESVSKRIAELNIEKQVVTEDTIKLLKEMRATLNKEKAEFETQRKDIKKKVNEPYVELEDEYKIQIIDKYDPAIKMLGEKIGEFETKIKEDRKSEIVLYFGGLCLAEQIDFITFDKTGIEINLSSSMKSYKDKCKEIVDKIKDDLSLIATEEYQAEILAEYKKTLNASKAIIDIKTRKELEKKEADRIKQAETDRRQKQLRDICFVSHELTKTFNWVTDENVFITFSEIDSLSKDEFEAKLNQFKSITEPKVEVLNAPIVEVKQTQTQAPERTTTQQKAENSTTEIIDISFMVEGTRAQLIALNDYLKQSGLTYKQL